MALPDDMIGAIKIKDGLFIGDEFAAQVSFYYWMIIIGFGICGSQQSNTHSKLFSKINPKSLGSNRGSLPFLFVAGLRKLNTIWRKRSNNQRDFWLYWISC